MREVDLIVVGSTRAGMSLAIEAREAGAKNVVVVDRGGSSLHLPIESHPDIEIVRGEPQEIEAADGQVVLAIDGSEMSAVAAAVIDEKDSLVLPDLEVSPGLEDRIHHGEVPEKAWGRHVLVIGGSERAAEAAIDLAEHGTNVVLARGNVSASRLSRLTRSTLLLREAERRITVLWHSRPEGIENIGGEPLVRFDDIGTPDLVFDAIIMIDNCSPIDTDISGPIWRVGDTALDPGRAWDRIRAGSFDHLQPDTVPEEASPDTESRIEELRQQHYNSTITRFERTHSDLWLIRVEPDHGDISYQAGQYASLGLGYWEPRADGARDPDLDRKWEKLVRRSYSISSPIFDDDGYLEDPARSTSLEFYIVLVPPSGDHVPGLTPRLALCQPGDRIYMGPRIVGRYTLAPVRDPEQTVVFLATGTGEAPHNAMITELLRKGHHGPIVSVVSVRYRADLAYLDTHRRLEERFPNYRYVPLVTREPDVEKLYVQDVLRRDMLTEDHGIELDPANTHVFLCGNPAMIGIPRWEDDRPIFPEPEGACQLLAERGFDLDRHGHVGNVHTEKYW
ncbi:MAG: hypothetical protein ACLFWM_03735 [Actinomycetota bacterium]